MNAFYQCLIFAMQEHERIDYQGKAKEHLVLRGHHEAVTHLAFSPSGLFLATGCAQGLVNVWGLHVSYTLYVTLISRNILSFV